MNFSFAYWQGDLILSHPVLFPAAQAIITSCSAWKSGFNEILNFYVRTLPSSLTYVYTLQYELSGEAEPNSPICQDFKSPEVMKREKFEHFAITFLELMII